MPEQTDPIRQFRLALLALVALVVLGTLGYQILERWSLLDSLYMTVITLGTVGFSDHPSSHCAPLDPAGKLFTMALIVFGVGIVFWAGASLVEAVIGEQIWHALQRKKMAKQISTMRDHYIICGFGRMGQQIAKDLDREHVPYVVIERNPEQMPKLIALETPFVEGNASDDKTLTAAGIERAKGLITVAPSDEDNVFITLSARALNPRLFIVARSILEGNEDKLKMAGADRVMSPYVMGGKRMATAVLRPNVLDFLELAMHADDESIGIEELTVGPSCDLAGRKLAEIGIRKATGGAVVAIRKASGKMIANPPDDEVVREGDVLIVLGLPSQLANAEKMICPI